MRVLPLMCADAQGAWALATLDGDPHNVGMATAVPAVTVAPPEDIETHTTSADRFVRSEHLEDGYSPFRHMARTLAISAGLSAVGIALAWRASLLDWLLMPVFFVVANFMEWAVHRFPMHRPLSPRLMYRNHAM